MSWVMTSKRFSGGYGDPPRVDFCIGSVKIAEIVMDKRASKWKFYLRLMANPVTYDVPGEKFETFGEALSFLHTRLNSPAPEGFETGRSVK